MKWLSDLGAELGGLLLDGAKLLFSKRLAAFVTAIALAVLALGIGGWSIRRADRYQRLVEAAVAKTTENTPQTMKALESLILANIETDEAGNEIQFKQNVANAILSEQFRQILITLHKTFSAPTSAPSAQLMLAKAEASVHDAVITESQPVEDDHGFLFLPTRLLYPSDEQYAEIRRGHIAGLLGVQSRDGRDQCGVSAVRELCDDVLTTRALVKPLVDSTSPGFALTQTALPGLDALPVQAYVISENGVNRIVSQMGHDVERYSQQFNAAMSFPARPYYVAARKEANLRNSQDPRPLDKDLKEGMPLGGPDGYFYISEPYLDIGGNGIVVTLARAFRYDAHSDGVVAFDLTVANYGTIRRKLETMVYGLDGVTAIATCSSAESGEPECQRTSGDVDFYADVDKDLRKQVHAASRSHSISDVAGNIQVLPSDPSQLPTTTHATTNAGVVVNLVLDRLARLVTHESKEVRFTVPIEPRQMPVAGTERMTLLVASVNIGRFLQNTAIASALALFLLGVAMTIVVASFATESRLRDAQIAAKKKLDETAAEERKKLDAAALKEREDLRTALGNVAEVMQSADDPYVRLDNDDHVIDGNPALAGFLKLSATKDSVQRRIVHTKFEDWLADDTSRTVYRRVQKLRREGQPVQPYYLTFRCVDGQPVVAMVVSSVVPATQLSSDGVPETFGILVKRTE
jgi:PAS domain-containing protein